MSWDVSAHVTVDGHQLSIFDTNYTHNCNEMIRAAGWVGFWPADPDHPLSSPELSQYLAVVLAAFDEDPDRFRAMNPANGWGDFDSLRDLLREMRDKATDFPSATWEFSG